MSGEGSMMIMKILDILLQAYRSLNSFELMAAGVFFSFPFLMTVCYAFISLL